MGRYEICEKIVTSGSSKVFKQWNQEAGVTQEDFLAGLRWLYDDPGLDVDASGKRFKPLERELGCHYEKGIVRLKRINAKTGVRFAEVDTNEAWNPSWRTLEDGKTLRLTGVSISAEDRI